MAEETFELQKEVSDFLALEGIESVDDFKTKFGESFIRRDKVMDDEDLKAKFTGRIAGMIETVVRRVTKEKTGVEIAEADIADMKWEEVVDHGLTKSLEAKDAKITELEANSSGDDSAKVKNLQKDLATMTAKHEDEKTLKDDAITKYTDLETSSGDKIKGIQLDTLKKDLSRNLKISDGVDPLKKKGFISEMNEKYKLTLGGDDNDTLVITDTKGDKIKSDKVSGEFLSPAEVYEKESIDAKIYSLSPADPKTPVVVKVGDEDDDTPKDLHGHRKVISARAVANAGATP